MGKNVVFEPKGCLKSIPKHPFLVCTLCFLMFMHRLSPVLFSLLVSASPVFVCTAVLLGALLSLGQPNDARVDRRSKRAAALVKRSVVGQINRYYDVGRKQDETMNGEIRRGVSGLVENQGIVLRKVEIREFDRRLKRKKKVKTTNMSESNEEGSDVSALRQKLSENLESDYEKSDADSFDSQKVNVDSSPHSPWATVVNQNGDEGDDDTLDSSSESVSSSPDDTSTAESMPMLNELHPLLDEDGALPVQMLLQSSQAASEMSALSTTSGNDSDVETNEEIEDEDDDTMDERDERRKPAIVWTEEDQKNLQDLGSSEIERNQRLESLLKRRIERKYKSMVPDVNLIDMELENSGGTPFNIAPITTVRQNPFEVASDGYEDSGLPPIPGSAPSHLQRRRNPFDTPCDSSEEKSNEIGGEPRDITFFRRRDEKHDVKMRPYFVPESPFLPQSSKMRDSRLSSVPETTSVSSVEDTDDQRLADEDVTENWPSGENQVPEMTSEHISQTSEEQSSIGDCYEEGTVVEPSKKSSSSSFSETSERFFNETEGEDGSKDDLADDWDIPTRTSARSTVASSPANEASHKEPVYDSTPPTCNKNLSPYNSYDLQSEPHLDILPTLLKRTASLVKRNSDGSSREIERFVSSSVEKFPESSEDKSAGRSDEEKQHPTTISGRESLTHVRISSSARQVEASLDSIDEEDDDVYHEADVKISTPAVRETSTVFTRGMKNNPNFERLKEVQVPNTPVDLDKLQAIPNLNIPNIRSKLIDMTVHDNSPYTPDVPSMPSSASKESAPHFNMQTILEEVGNVKETNDESDSEGHDYWPTRPTAFDLYVDSIEESSSGAEKLGSTDGDEINVKENHSNDGSDTVPSATRTSTEDVSSKKVGLLGDKTDDNGKSPDSNLSFKSNDVDN